jgi:hypothetical protein
MAGLICVHCGFHNEPTAGACVSCGYALPSAAPGTAGADAGAQGDPHAMTRLVPSVQPCWNCGTPNEQTRTFCQSCGQQLHATTQSWPAVAPPPPGTATPADAQSPAPPPIAGAAVRPRRRRRRWVPLLGAAAFGALLVAAGFVVAGMLGQGGANPLTGGAADRTGGARSPAAETAPARDRESPPPAETRGAGGEGFRCETQSLTAAEPGTWTVARARWGQRSGFDYISFVLRRGGNSDEAATVTAELMPLDEVESRFGVDPPTGGDLALMVTFERTVRLSGPFGRNVNQRALQEFRLLRGDDVVHAVLGVAGSGCFQMSAPGWDDGRPRNVEVTLQIERG